MKGGKNMVVKMTRESKKYITIEECERAQKVISSMKEDTSTVNDYAAIAIRVAFYGKAYSIDILKATAELMKNHRVWNLYTEDSGEIDVYIKATAFVNNSEYVMISGYLSDIWQVTGKNNEEIATHMYVRRFKEV